MNIYVLFSKDTTTLRKEVKTKIFFFHGSTLGDLNLSSMKWKKPFVSSLVDTEHLSIDYSPLQLLSSLTPLFFLWPWYLLLYAFTKLDFPEFCTEDHFPSSWWSQDMELTFVALSGQKCWFAFIDPQQGNNKVENVGLYHFVLSV